MEEVMTKSTFERIESGARTNLILTVFLAILIGGVSIWIYAGCPI